MLLEDVASIYPLSPLQQGVVIDVLRAPSARFHLMQMVYLLEGEINLPAFHRAWNQVLERHEALRTAFALKGLDHMMQVVLRQAQVPFRSDDLTSLSKPEQDLAIQDFLKADRGKGFDLSEAPLMRVTVLRVGDKNSHCIWSYHHVILDGWSSAVVLNDVIDHYEALCDNRELEPAQSEPYREYITWLQQQDLAGAEVFWREKLAGLTEPTTLVPWGNKIGTERRAELWLRCSERTTRSLEQMARKYRLTLNTVVQGAWALIVSVYSGKKDILFGATSSGRPAGLPGIDGMVGLLLNNLPIRVRLNPEQWIVDWLGQLQREQAECSQYEYVPLADLRKWSGIAQGREHLFESLLVFENFPTRGLQRTKVRQEDKQRREDELRVLSTRSLEQTTFPLGITINPGEELSFRAIYDSGIFENDTVERILGHLRQVLESIAAYPGQTLREISLVTPQERQQLVVDWNRTQRAYPDQFGIQQLFEQQVERTPDAVAVVHEGRQWSYAELNGKANQLAHSLRRMGVGPDVPVALCVERGLEMMVGLLGVLKAGGAYVPLDPAYPSERLAYMLQDAQAPVLLVQESLRDSLPVYWAQVISLDGEWSRIAEESDKNPEVVGSPDNLAYVIYTSGSTGQPKGVAVTHRGVCNLARAQDEKLQLGSESVILQFASFSFDASAWEWTMALLRGARLVLINREEAVPGASLVDLMKRECITTVTLPPTVLAALGEQELPALETLVVAGEACPAELTSRWAKRCRMINAYGPTESTVCATMSDPLEAERAPGIGVPIANTRVYVLDEAGEVVPIGVAGELYVGGAGLARGYLNRPALTAERFVPDPFAVEPGGRLYRTGDRVRWNSGAELEFLGRRDEQVKLRGYRIELGEIEAVLNEHSGVRQSAVVVKEDERGDKRLVAYVVGEVGSSELRQYLQGRVPDYMVPGGYVMVDSLPLTANGKLDRKALPQWGEEERREGAAGYVGPRTAVEEILAGIWADVLGVERVGVHDNFFELGGHSLLATKVTSRIQNICQVEIPLRTLFEAPTVAGSAEMVEKGLKEGMVLEAPPIERGSREGELALSFAQQRLWFIDQLEPGNTAYNCPAGLRLTGDLHYTALERSLSEIVRRHEVLRTTFPVRNGKPLQQIAPARAVPLPVVDLSVLGARHRESLASRLAEQEAERAFDLAQGPLLRCSLLRLAEQEHVLLVTMHHIVSDGWSIGILVRELNVLYEAYSEDRPSPLPELPVQYSDFAQWQRKWLEGEVLDQQLGYWKKQLDGVTGLNLPTDCPRPAVASHRGGAVSFHWPAELSRQLKQLSRARGTTLFMTLLAGFQLLLSRYSGQSDIAVGTDVANRNRLETEGLIGFFINQLVLRTDLSGNPTFIELLERVREVTLGAYAHQDLPFERLVEELAPERDLSRAPLFSVMLTMLNTRTSAVEVPGLLTVPLEISSGTAKLDLILSFTATSAGIAGTIEYNRDIFTRHSADQMLNRYELLLRNVCRDPYQSIHTVRISDDTDAEASAFSGNLEVLS